MLQSNNLKKNQTLIAGLVTIALLFLITSVFFIKKNWEQKNKSEIEIIDEKTEKKNFDITLIKPEDVFKAVRKDDFLIIDTRGKEEFKKNHIESSKNIPMENLATSPLPKDKTLIIVEKQETIDGKEITSQLKDSDYKITYLEGGLYAYLENGHHLISYGDPISIQDKAKTTALDLNSLGKRLMDGERFIYLDVREKEKFEKDNFEKSINIPLEELEERKFEIPGGKILIIDEDITRSFKASVRLTDMNILTNYYLANPYSELKSAVENQTLFGE
jgi:rhodanese-related sulfurtransferase